MKNTTALIFLTFLAIQVIAQELSGEQKAAIEQEQLMLKEGKINYDEFQQRVQKIKSKEKNSVSSDSLNNVVQSSDRNLNTETKVQSSSSEIKQMNSLPNRSDGSTDNNDVNQLNNSKPIFRKNGLRPGDELIRFSRQFYTGLGAVVIGYGISFTGAILSVATGGVAGIGLVLVGSLAGSVGIGVVIASFTHIKKAGQIMNQLEELH